MGGGNGSGGGEIRFPAVSLTYDGSLPSHLESVLPDLEACGLRGTFYSVPEALVKNARAWEAVSNEGHEIGSGTLHSAADPRGNLPNWTLEMVEEELRASRRLLAELFLRQADFSFAYPGFEAGCLTVPYNPEPTTYDGVVERLFEVACRGFGEWNDAAGCSLTALHRHEVSGLSGAELISFAEVAIEEGRWAIYAFRGVGVGDEAVDASAHRELCEWLAERAEELRTEAVFRTAMLLRSLREAPAQGGFLKNL